MQRLNFNDKVIHDNKKSHFTIYMRYCIKYWHNLQYT